MPRKLLLICASLLLFGCGEDEGSAGPSQPETPEQLVQRGEAIYRGKCALCHASGMFGARPLSDALTVASERVLNFEQHVAALEKSDPEHRAEKAEALDALLALEGQERLDAWLRAYIADPRLDRTTSKMNPVELRGRDEDALLAWLMTQLPQ